MATKQKEKQATKGEKRKNISVDSLEDVKNETKNDEESGEATPLTFRALGVCDTLADTCEKLGYKKPTKIQRGMWRRSFHIYPTSICCGRN
tara:strand:- start:1184 stop:1456 length:273 start_codon:yes stop_codon:yes gene_type:complete